MIAALWIGLAAVPAHAHGGVSRNVHITEDALTVTARSEDVLGQLGMEVSDASRHHAAIARWLATGITVATDQPCTLGPVDVRVGGQVAVTRRLHCEPGPLHVVDTTLRAATPGEQTVVQVARGGIHQSVVLDRDQPTVVVDGALTLGQTVLRYVRQGAVHLVTGYDHVLFLLCLLAAAGPTVRRQGTGAALRQLAHTVTAFTLGHSVTLSAAALGWVVLPGRAVEVVIAASIALAAALNVLRPDGQGSPRAALALGFGLVHGLGFSSVLAEIGLPTGSRIASLFAFNVGIELAQLAVVAVAMVPLAWLARHPAVYRRLVMQAGSVGVGLLSLVWMTQRLAAP